MTVGMGVGIAPWAGQAASAVGVAAAANGPLIGQPLPVAASAPAPDMHIAQPGGAAAAQHAQHAAQHAPHSTQLGSAAAALGVAGGALAAGRRRAAQHGRRCRAGRPRGVDVTCRAAAAVAETEVSASSSASSAGGAGGDGEAAAQPARPLQIIKIDLETNSVLVGNEEIKELEAALRRSGVEKVALVGVMGAFRTGKSFLLDLMLRYMRENAIPVDARQGKKKTANEECEVPAWVLKNGVPDWAVKCGESLVEGREGRDQPGDMNGFQWRPGMDKCTEGVWVWSEAFICKSRDENGVEEDVAVLLMDTQGAWDAKMTKEQSATVFGLTTLMASRLIYNVSKQIQQDKIDNLLYFTEFAQAALRSKQRRADGSPAPASERKIRPFQTLEFLVRDWPHYAENAGFEEGRVMMINHLAQYMDPLVSEDTQSIDSLSSMFDNIDVWCLPHPSLTVEREAWDGDLKVVEPQFWRFMDKYFSKIFGPEELQAKTTLGSAITVDTFSDVLREFIYAFKDAAPQAQTFSEAMETSTSLLARDSAMKKLRRLMEEQATSKEEALAPQEFDKLAEEAAIEAEAEFQNKAIFGSEEGISRVGEALKKDVKEELQRLRAENDRKLEASLSGLTDASLAAVAAFGLDKVSDVTCDWWSGVCQEISGDLSLGYTGVLLYVIYRLSNIQSQSGQLDAAVAAIELGKSMSKKANRLFEDAKDEFGKNSAAADKSP